MNRAELELLTADTEALEALETAKERYRAKPTDANKAKLTEAKVTVRGLRAHWRGIREHVNGPPVAKTVRATTKMKEG